jgi:diguanylate cyclase (GGDEF)-like protein/PAS domain S-box-containing protein
VKRVRQLLLPLAILLAGFCVTWLACRHERDVSEQALRAQFDFSLREAVSRVEQRVAGYEQILRGVQGLFVATGRIDRQLFRDYIAPLNLEASYSGIQAIAVEQWLHAEDKSAHIAAMRAQGFADYAIRPTGERSAYAPIIMREPYVSRNQYAFGYDPWSESRRRQAMEKARDSGRAVISGKVLLDIDTGKGGAAQPSFLMYLPVYMHDRPQATIPERRANLLGWVHASFRMSDVIASLYGEQPQGVSFAIYDGVEPSPESLLYRSVNVNAVFSKASISATEYLVVAGHNWTLRMEALDDFGSRFGRDAVLQTALTGIGLSLLLAALAWALASSRWRAWHLAEQMTSELRASEEQFRAIADSTINWEIWWGLDGRPRWINPSVFEYTGYTAEECLAMPNLREQLIYPEDQPRVMPLLEQGLKGTRGTDLEFRCVRKDGVVFWLSVSWGPTNEVNGAFNGFRTSGRDITERKHAEEELRIAAVAFDSLEGMMVTDAQNRILRVNHAFTEMTGYSAAEVIGKTPRVLRSDRHNAAFHRAIWDSVRHSGGWQGEIWNRRKNGKVYPEWLTISAVKGSDGIVTHYVGTHHDITERKIAEERIKELAFFDSLTRLPNRALLLDRLKQAIAVSARNRTCSALLFIDLDHFKTLNDTLGHDKGDLLLQQVAQRLALSIRANDTVARVGGDEFVVVLEDLHQQAEEATSQTRLIGEKILSVLDSPYQLAEVEYRITASVGATVFRGRQCTIDELLKQADLAMYKSKEIGRNAMRFFDPLMQAVVLERVALEAGLRKAIEGGQLVLHYQAQVVAGGRVTGAEVLVRWQDPQRGMVPPSEFIPLAEETGLILALGNWVLETACVQLARWAMRPETAHLTIAVNVSAQQFREADFVDTIYSTLTRTGADPKRLKLELTESLLVDNVEDIIRKMHALQEQGVEFALDDFGIGYSSLSYLKRLPLNQLKIDQSFVRDVLIDPNDASIAKTIVTLAQSLGLGVIAEGVETDAQRRFLAEAGCHAYQGYLFCRPLPVEDFEKYVRALISIESME